MIYGQGTKQNAVGDEGNHDLLCQQSLSGGVPGVLSSIIYDKGTKQNVVRDEEIETYLLICWL